MFSAALGVATSVLGLTQILGGAGTVDPGRTSNGGATAGRQSFQVRANIVKFAALFATQVGMQVAYLPTTGTRQTKTFQVRARIQQPSLPTFTVRGKILQTTFRTFETRAHISLLDTSVRVTRAGMQVAYLLGPGVKASAFQLRASITPFSFAVFSARARIFVPTTNFQTFDVRANIFVPLTTEQTFEIRAQIESKKLASFKGVFNVSGPKVLNVPVTYYSFGDNYSVQTFDVGAFITPDLNLTIEGSFYATLTDQPKVQSIESSAKLFTQRSFSLQAAIIR